MKKILVLGLLIVVLAIMFPVSSIFAQDKPKEQPKEVVLENERDFMFWVIGPKTQENYPGLNFKIIGEDTPKEEYTASSSLPDKPVKIIFNASPYIIKGWFSGDHYYKSTREEYGIILFGFGTAAPYEYEEIKGNVHVTYLLKLNPKFLKPEHFDLLLNALRTHIPVRIEGYVYDKAKDVAVVKRDLKNWFEIAITMHPISINGEKLY